MENQGGGSVDRVLRERLQEKARVDKWAPLELGQPFPWNRGMLWVPWMQQSREGSWSALEPGGAKQLSEVEVCWGGNSCHTVHQWRTATCPRPPKVRDGYLLFPVALLAKEPQSSARRGEDDRPASAWNTLSRIRTTWVSKTSPGTQWAGEE